MKDKLIRLSDALQAVRESYIWDSEISQRTLEKKLAALPEAADRQEWIPVSEGLPEEGETVLGWIGSYSWGEEDEPERVRECAIGWHMYELWHFSGYMSRTTKCLAWMPLPEAYEEE